LARTKKNDAGEGETPGRSAIHLSSPSPHICAAFPFSLLSGTGHPIIAMAITRHAHRENRVQNSCCLRSGKLLPDDLLNNLSKKHVNPAGDVRISLAHLSVQATGTRARVLSSPVHCSEVTKYKPYLAYDLHRDTLPESSEVVEHNESRRPWTESKLLKVRDWRCGLLLIQTESMAP
jgi:hypothetical protein